MKNIASLFIVVFLVTPVPLLAATPTTAAVEARAASYIEAFNRRDIDGCVEHWSEEAEYISSDPAKRVEGRIAIREALKRLIDTDERFELSVSNQRFRPVSKDVVIEEGTASVVSASHGLEQAQYVVVYVNQDGKWYRNSVRETASATPLSAAHLSKLNWLVGKWQRSDDHGSVSMEGEWMKNKRFITLSFEIRDKDGFELNGKQVIGWDPSSGVVRSWTFDSQGGFEQAVWTHDESRWLVKVSAVLPDGSTGSEQRILTQVDDSNFTYDVIEQQVNGQLMPSPAKVTLTKTH